MTAHPRNTTGYPSWTPAQDTGYLTPAPVPPDALLGTVPAGPGAAPMGLPPAQRTSAHRTPSAHRSTASQPVVSWPGLPQPGEPAEPAAGIVGSADRVDVDATPPAGLRLGPHRTQSTLSTSMLDSTGTWPLEMLNSHSAPPVAAPAPAPSRRPWLHIIGYPVVLVAGIAIGLVPQYAQAHSGAGASPRTASAPASVAQTTDLGADQNLSASTDAAKPQKSFTDGTFMVGQDITPGHYVTTAADGSLGCYWARLQDTDGDLDSIIANGNIHSRTTVTIHASDGAFEASGGCLWTRR